MQSKDKCQKSRRNGNSRKSTDRFVGVPVVLERQCQPSAQVLERVPTTSAKDTKMPKDQNVASQTPNAKTRFMRKNRERQPTKRCQGRLKHERESMKAPPNMKTGRSLRTCLSRGVR